VSVPIIGAPQSKKPPLQINIGAAPGGGVILDLCLMDVDHRIATVNAQSAISIMQQIGVAIEEGNPGSLILGLKSWLADLESMKAHGKKVLEELGL
jgi:hypothetical protein